MELVAPADLSPFSDFFSTREVVWRRIHFPIPEILGNNLVEFGVAVLLREASEVQRVNLIRLELEDGVGGRIVDCLARRL